MTTSPYQQADYKTNVDQTNRHLHVTSGDLTLSVEEQKSFQYEMRLLLSEILEQNKKINKYLSLIVGDEIKDGEI